ncbi:MAG: hypothetical protein JO286_00190 [Solirubrobacterales bacterium]|nr:hypothetical protein [Solirubrobacterales bacterium]
MRTFKLIRAPAWAMAAGAALALVSAGAGSAAAATTSAVVINQQEGNTRFIVIWSRYGVATTIFTRGAHGHAAFGATVTLRYRDGRLVLVRPKEREFATTGLSTAIGGASQDLYEVSHMRVPELAGVTSSPAPLAVTTLVPLHRRREIRGLQADGYLLRTYLNHRPVLTERIWYAIGLRPPDPVADVLERAHRPAGAAGLAGAVALQTDIRGSHGFQSLLTTTSVRRMRIRLGYLSAPTGSRRAPWRNLYGPGPRAGARSASLDLPASVNPGVGPYVSHPKIWPIFWGGAFAANGATFARRMTSALGLIATTYVNPRTLTDLPALPPGSNGLDQYGIRPGTVGQWMVDLSNPPRDTGGRTLTALRISNFVQGHRIRGIPRCWDRTAEYDPIVAVFIRSSDVEDSSWAGYHLATPTECWFIIPFPFNYIFHVALPYMVVRVPDSALDVTWFGSSSPQAEGAFDEATKTASHEFAETTTDPYPFFGWQDPSKQPFYAESEIADICADEGNSTYGTATRFFPTFSPVVLGSGNDLPAVATYWSNGNRGCVPESRPWLHVDLPLDHDTTDSPLALRGYALDRVKQLPDMAQVALPIEWRLDGRLIGTTYPTVAGAASAFDYTPLQTPVMAPGTHTITATAYGSDRQALTRQSVTVTATTPRMPAITIASPVDGASYGTDQNMPLHASASDRVDGDLSGKIVWTLDGASTPVATGSDTTYRLPTVGQHTITATVANSIGMTASQSVTVTGVPAAGDPSVTITQPTGCPCKISVYAPPTASAQASDPVDGQLPGSALKWHDDAVGDLGTGNTVTIPCACLNGVSRTHHIVVTATDSRGHTATDSVTITIYVPVP